MALAFTELTAFWSDTDATSYVSASISPAANSLLLMPWTSRHGTTAPGLTPTNTFGGTWVEPLAEQVDGISAIGFHYIICGASPGSGTVTLSVDGGVTAIGAGCNIIQVTGYDTVTPILNQTKGPTGTTGLTASVTSQPAMSGPTTNAQFFYCHHRASEAVSAEAGWTAGTSTTGAAPNMGMGVEWKIASEDTTATMTWTTSVRWQSLYMEIKAASAAAAATPYKWRLNRSGLLVAR